MADFNPCFTFSFESEPNASIKPAWEFSGALKQAKAEQNGNTRATSVDQKIGRRLTANADMKEWKAEDKHKRREQRKAALNGSSQVAKGAKDGGKRGGSEEDSEEDAEDDSDDEPLPGELDEDSDEDGEVLEEEEEEEGEEAESSGDGDDDEEEEQEDPRVKARQQQQQRKQEQQRLLQQKQQRAQLAGRKRQQEEEQAQRREEGNQGNGVSADFGEGDDEAATQQPQKKGKQQQQQNDSRQQDSQQQQKQSKQQQQHVDRDAASIREQPGASTSGKGIEERGRAAVQGGFFARTPDGTTFTATSFADLQLSRPLLKAITGLGYTTPTPIQAAVVPLALAGRDVCGSAITGSGKTAAFALPCLERLLHRPRQIAATYVLVLTPTRELAVQVHSMITTLAQHTDISAALVVGGLSSQVQASVLRRRPEIVVATPGRLIDHLHNTQSVGLEDLAVLILDEADRLLEMGFKEEVTEILRMAPKKRQTMLFSATFNDEVRQLMALSLKQPVRLAADAAAAVPKELRQEVVRLKGAAAAHKEAVLLAMCSRSFKGAPSIIFFRTKQRTHRLKILFGLLGLPLAAELHGDMTQAARLEALEMFRTREASFLLATDVAARGLDISGVQVVINYDTPRTLETYLHRIGRTARAGAAGVGVTFVEDSDRQLLKEVVRRTKANVCQRLVPAASVAQWQAKLEAAEADVAQVISEERYEREMRKAEMEVNKAQNMIDHSNEIHSRPARSWFQTGRQKKESAQRAGRAAAGLPLLPGDVDDKDDEQASKKQQEKKNKKKERLKQEAAEKKANAKKEDSLMQETGEHIRQIRSAKSKIRALREQGMTAAAAAKVVAATAAPKSAKKKKKSGPAGASAGGGDGLFSGDGTGRPAVSPGAAKGSGDAGNKEAGAKTNKRSDRTGFSNALLNRIKRGGVGKKAFKSKKKYQRKKK